MKIANQQSPNFQMNIQGLENKYFETVSQKLKEELVLKASLAKEADFTLEFVPTRDNWVFLKKIIGNRSCIVDYFPSAYKPIDIIRTFIKAYIPKHRIMAKNLQKEVMAKEAQQMYKEHGAYVTNSITL